MIGDPDDGLAPYDDVNVTPMVDLTLVLLIIFIILTTAAVQGIAVELPRASAAPPLQDRHARTITVAADGTLYFDTFVVTLGELEQRLVAARAMDARMPVAIKGDAAVHYQLVIDVLDLCARLGITEVGLVTQRPARRPPA